MIPTVEIHVLDGSMPRKSSKIEAYLEQESIELNKKQQDALFSIKTWETQCSLMIVGEWLREQAEAMGGV